MGRQVQASVFCLFFFSATPWWRTVGNKTRMRGQALRSWLRCLKIWCFRMWNILTLPCWMRLKITINFKNRRQEKSTVITDLGRKNYLLLIWPFSTNFKDILNDVSVVVVNVYSSPFHCAARSLINELGCAFCCVLLWFHFEPPTKLIFEKKKHSWFYFSGIWGTAGIKLPASWSKVELLRPRSLRETLLRLEESSALTRATLGESTFHTFPYKTWRTVDIGSARMVIPIA